MLADKRVNPSSDDNYAIMEDLKYDHVEVVKLLLQDERVKLFTKDELINYISSIYKNDDIKFLLEKCKFNN